jgi:hypothetical protein
MIYYTHHCVWAEVFSDDYDDKIKYYTHHS